MSHIVDARNCFVHPLRPTRFRHRKLSHLDASTVTKIGRTLVGSSGRKNTLARSAESLEFGLELGCGALRLGHLFDARAPKTTQPLDVALHKPGVRHAQPSFTDDHGRELGVAHTLEHELTLFRGRKIPGAEIAHMNNTHLSQERHDQGCIVAHNLAGEPDGIDRRFAQALEVVKLATPQIALHDVSRKSPADLFRGRPEACLAEGVGLWVLREGCEQREEPLLRIKVRVQIVGGADREPAHGNTPWAAARRRRAGPKRETYRFKYVRKDVTAPAAAATSLA